jgi:hypothetical protein
MSVLHALRAFAIAPDAIAVVACRREHKGDRRSASPEALKPSGDIWCALLSSAKALAPRPRQEGRCTAVLRKAGLHRPLPACWHSGLVSLAGLSRTCLRKRRTAVPAAMFLASSSKAIVFDLVSSGSTIQLRGLARAVDGRQKAGGGGHETGSSDLAALRPDAVDIPKGQASMDGHGAVVSSIGAFASLRVRAGWLRPNVA